MAFIIFSMWISKYASHLIDRHRIGRHAENEAARAANANPRFRAVIVPTDRICESNDSLIKQIISPKNSFYEVLHSETNINRANDITNDRVDTADNWVYSPAQAESENNRMANNTTTFNKQATLLNSNQRNIPKMEMRRSTGGVQDTRSSIIDLQMEVISPPNYDVYRKEIDELLKANGTLKKKKLPKYQTFTSNVKGLFGIKGNK